mmetsp:Transcript_18846/g.52585  ORF Transcript_18846/g.52585 Transcript_18846/m.52585 type:complete len:386 (+) Transcript_18846:69-1226(+)
MSAKMQTHNFCNDGEDAHSQLRLSEAFWDFWEASCAVFPELTLEVGDGAGHLGLRQADRPSRIDEHDDRSNVKTAEYDAVRSASSKAMPVQPLSSMNNRSFGSLRASGTPSTPQKPQLQKALAQDSCNWGETNVDHVNCGVDSLPRLSSLGSRKLATRPAGQQGQNEVVARTACPWPLTPRGTEHRQTISADCEIPSLVDQQQQPTGRWSSSSSQHELVKFSPGQYSAVGSDNEKQLPQEARAYSPASDASSKNTSCNTCDPSLLTTPPSSPPRVTSGGSPGAAAGSSLETGSFCRCRVKSCNVDISPRDRYQRRRKMCRPCMASLRLDIDGEDMRFCQKCGRLHRLDQFDGSMRSCRTMLLKQKARNMKLRALCAQTRGRTPRS